MREHPKKEQRLGPTLCPGCKLQKTLVRSHLIPQAIYDYLRGADGASPVRVGNDVIMRSDRQIQDYLLCKDCEDMLNSCGETWTNPKLATVGKAFPLYDLLMKSFAAYADENGGIYYANANPELDVEKLTHFALGIFWKAAIHSWSGTTQDPMIDLGGYDEPIRTWLRGETDFPKEATLVLTLAKPETALIILQQPLEIPGVPWRRYHSYVPGLMCSLNVGAKIEQQMKEVCFYKTEEHPIFVLDDVMSQFNARLGKHYAESRKTKSYLNQRAKRQKNLSRPKDGKDSRN